MIIRLIQYFIFIIILTLPHNNALTFNEHFVVKYLFKFTLSLIKLRASSNSVMVTLEGLASSTTESPIKPVLIMI